jgi:hypothetical protein
MGYARSGVDPEIEEVSVAEGREIFDRAARETLHVSGDEFLARWDAGEYDGSEDPAVAGVSILMPFAR